jgi:hypothetical protein
MVVTWLGQSTTKFNVQGVHAPSNPKNRELTVDRFFHYGRDARNVLEGLLTGKH